MYVFVLSVLLVTDRHCRVVASVVVDHREGHVFLASASVPADRRTVLVYGRTIDAGQASVNSIVA